ncbi:MAG TPA: TlpA disulfide reductase family protein [Myxococcales bacterium]|jgi:thiol-disulfide isomerase/thioredoxin|nr:TlpA disulfide reductase family protein [Myxococcales bacterium]
MSAQPRGADRFLWVIVAAAAIAVLVVAVARGRLRRPEPQKGAITAVSLPLLDGTGRSSIAPGRVTVVDFWATWCAPCRVSMPRVQSIWREYHPRGVDLYSVDTDDPGAEREMQVHDFLRGNGLEFPVVLDDGSAASAFAVAVLPTMAVVDRSGRVVWNHVGVLTASSERELRSVLDSALSASAARSGG